MTCQDLVRSLSDYIDGTLSPSEREEIERHLAVCEECANTLADLRGVVARSTGSAGPH